MLSSKARLVRHATPLICAGLACFSVSATAQEQSGPVPASSTSLAPRTENGRQIYEVVQFERFAPQTALDMVAQIPGFQINGVSSDRGLGEASQNVLINGQRVTGKSNDATTALSRIPAGSVIRLEIADGATLNVSGLQGQVVNVITRPDKFKGNFTWKPEWRETLNPNLLTLAVNISGKLGKGDYTLGVNNSGAFRNGNRGAEVRRGALGNLLYTRQSVGLFNGERPRIAGTYSRKSDGGNIFNANGAFEIFRFRARRNIDRITPGLPTSFEQAVSTEDEWNMEAGADYEFPVLGGRLKLIGFQRFEHSPTLSQFVSGPTATRLNSGQQFDRTVDESESVLRGEYRWKKGKADWQISFEGAYNFLDSAAELRSFNAQSGGYDPVAIDGASARVAEKRAQAIVSYGRPLTKKLTLQLTAGGEYSELSQTGANGLTRQFVRPKGSASLAWKASPRLSMSGKLQRKVGQLSFFDFLATVDVVNNNNNSSNARLVPPQSWLAEFEATQSLGKAGSLRLKVEGEAISDLVDQIPISATEEAVGNLSGSAKRISGDVTGSFVLDVIGLNGAKLDASVGLQTSSLRDPLTGTKRPISNNGKAVWKLDFRHDIPSTPWAWGFYAEKEVSYGFYRLNYYQREFTNAPFSMIFVEHKDVLGLKVRASLSNLNSMHENYRRIFYVNRRNGPVDFTGDGDFKTGLISRLSISGTF